MKFRNLFRLVPLLAPAALQAAPISSYTRHATHPLANTSEASAVTYSRDTNSLYIIGDEGGDITQYSKTGQVINSMRMIGPGDKPDTEGIAYLGNGRFLVGDERSQTGSIYTYSPGSQGVNRSAVYTFGAATGNIGLEGLSYDPLTNSIWGVKETGPQSIYRMGSSSTTQWVGNGQSILNPINPGQLRVNGVGLADLADIYVLAGSNAFAGTTQEGNILVLSQESNLIYEVNRSGAVVSSLDLNFMGSDSIEGLVMDDDGVLYLTSEDTRSGGASTLHVLKTPPPPPQNFTLQILHLSDGEAGLLASQTAPNLAALIDAFDGTQPNTLILSGGDNFIPSPFLSAGTDPSLNAVPGIGATAFARPDIAIHNAIGVEASAIGNHEWDLGSNVFADAFRAASPWPGAQFPHISANLDFSGDPAINPHFTDVPLDGTATAVAGAADRKGRIVPTAVITKGGEKIGLVGVTTQLIETIASPGGTRVKGFAPKAGVDDMDLLATQVQPYINELAAEGVNKIILLSHLQQISNEQALIGRLSGVDIILAAGSNTRLGDSDDVPASFPGHTPAFAGSYPLRTQDKDGRPALILNTDNEYTYLGRLVVDFTPEGEVIPSSLDSRVSTNGAYAATPENVAAAWSTTVGNLAATAFAAGTKGAAVKAITDAVQGVISAKDGQVYGYTTVYLEGERSFVRSEETNLGNITADANAAKMRAINGIPGPVVSIKNGGGIRAQIGAVSSAGGSALKLPPPANPSVGKQEGGVSQLDIENALRFDNKLIGFNTTPAGLKAILEHGVALWPNQGRFPQVGGVAFSWNPALAAGSRIVSLSLLDEDGEIGAALYKDGAAIAEAPATIPVVTLNFLANDGDGYPMKANGDNFRYLLADGTLGPVLDEANDFTVSPSLPANPIGEQKVFGDYLTARHPTPAAAYATADTPIAADLRIQKLDVRNDIVLPYPAADLANLNRHAVALRAAGLSPLLGMGTEALRGQGRAQILGNPSAHDLYTAESIQDLRGTGVLIRATGGEVRLTLPIQRSTTLGAGSWEAVGSLEATLPLTGDKAFYRLTLPE